MMWRTSASTSSSVCGETEPGWPGKSGPSLGPGSTETGPIFSDMPQRPTIWRAMFVTCSRSDSAPVVTSP